MANTFQDLPLPAFHGYMELLRNLHNCIKSKKRIQLVQGKGKFKRENSS